MGFCDDKVHFEQVLTAQGVDISKLVAEWQGVKTLLYSSVNWEDKLKKQTWKDLNRSHGDQYPNLLSLIDLVLTIPASTAECERGFSAMKRVKSDRAQFRGQV